MRLSNVSPLRSLSTILAFFSIWLFWNKKTKEIKDFITAVKAKTYERHFVTLPASDKKMIQSARYDDLTKSLLLNRDAGWSRREREEGWPPLLPWRL